MKTVKQRSLRRGIALAGVMMLLTGVTATALVSSVSTPVAAVSQNPGLIGGAADPFFVYVKAGEWITATGAANPGQSGGTGLQRVVAPDGTVTNVTTNSFTQQATQDGIWQIHYHTAYPHGTWDIKTSTAANGQGTYRPGRVWTETYHMTDNANARNVNHEFWVIDDSGYRYKVDLYDYIGINSTIQANALGITQGEECTPIYRSISISEQGGENPVQVDCGTPFRIFLEPPAVDLPASAMINGVDRWVAPDELLIDELTSGTIAFTPGTNAAVPGAGTVTTTVDPRFQGGYLIEIDADGDGDFNGPNDRRVQVAAKGGGEYSYQFDGLDNAGNPFPACTPMSARMTFESVGEIHMVQTDVEQRGGIGLQKLNGLHAGTSQERVIYWDDTALKLPGTGGDPLNGINPPYGPDGTAGAVSGPGVHGWDYVTGSWGDNRIVDDWTYTPLQSTHSDPVTFTSYCPQPAIEIEKSSDFTNDSRPGDTVTYTVTATNTGDGAYTEENPAVLLDDVSELFDDADVDVTSISADRPGDTSYRAPVISWEGALEPGDAVTLTYDVELKGGGDGVLRNTAWSPEDPEDRETPECVESDPLCEELITNLPKFTIEKSASEEAFSKPGDTVTYTVTVTNPGPGVFTVSAPATMSDDLSDVLASAEPVGEPQATIGSASFDEEGEKLNWVGVLGVDESAVITYEVQYTATYENEQDTVLENTACVPEDLVALGADACASVETLGPKLSQWKTVDSDDEPVTAGSEVRYTLHFENTGEAPATVNAVDHLDFVLDDASVAIDSATSPLTVTSEEGKLLITGTLAPGETATYTYVVAPKADGDRTDSTLSNFLTPEGEEPPGDGVCVPTDEERPDCTTTPVLASMLLEKRGQGPAGELPLAGAEFEIAPPVGDALAVTEESTVGVFLVTGLNTGVHTLTETKAPEGYALLADSIEFEVLPTGAISTTATDSIRVEYDGDGTWRLILTDVEAFTLPLSGGTGSAPWVIGGMLLAGLALITPIARARRDQTTSAALA